MGSEERLEEEVGDKVEDKDVTEEEGARRLSRLRSSFRVTRERLGGERRAQASQSLG